MRVGLNEDFLFREAERNDLVADGGTILQKEGKLRAKGFVVDFAQVSEAGSFEVQPLDVVHRQPTPVNLLHSVLRDQIPKGLVNVAARVRRQMELQGVVGLEIFHGLNEPLSLLHQTLFGVRWQ